MAEIMIAILGSQLVLWPLQFFLTRRCARRDREENKNELIIETLSVLTYNTLAVKLEYLLSKGYATPEERREVEKLYDIYNKYGWNGDMDSRMKKVYGLRTDRPSREMKS